MRTLSFHKTPTAESLAKSATVLAQVVSISFANCGDVTDAVVGELAKHCPQLRSINLTYCWKVTDVGVGELAKHCPGCNIRR